MKALKEIIPTILGYLFWIIFILGIEYLWFIAMLKGKWL